MLGVFKLGYLQLSFWGGEFMACVSSFCFLFVRFDCLVVCAARDHHTGGERAGVHIPSTGYISLHWTTDQLHLPLLRFLCWFSLFFLHVSYLRVNFSRWTTDGVWVFFGIEMGIGPACLITFLLPTALGGTYSNWNNMRVCIIA